MATSNIQMKNINECIIKSDGVKLADIDTIKLNGAKVWSSQAPDWDDRGLDYNSWTTIREYVRAGKLNEVTYRRARKSIIFDNEIYYTELMSINDGTGDAGQYYPANTADFLLVKLLDDSKMMSSNGDLSWKNSDIRNYLNNTIYYRLDSELRRCIVRKEHVRTAYDSNNVSYLETSSDLLWSPTVNEMSRTNISSTYDKRYGFFDYDDRIKFPNSGASGQTYWTSTPNFGVGLRKFSVIRYDGRDDLMSPTEYGYILMGFRIG